MKNPVKKGARKNTGTREWAEKTVNCCTGCAHDCRYCYAKSMAIRFKQVEAGEWGNMRVREKDVYKSHPKYGGMVMFPSSHDITEANRDACEKVIDRLITAGNEVLIVTKPHLETVEALCSAFRSYKDQIRFRFSIGSCLDSTLRFWEPNAPTYQERRSSLRYAYEAGFTTSISMEPLLEPARVDDMIAELMPWVRDTIWLGKVNQVKKLLRQFDPHVQEALVDLRKNQDVLWRNIWEKHRENPKIKWKEGVTT